MQLDVVFDKFEDVPVAIIKPLDFADSVDDVVFGMAVELVLFCNCAGYIFLMNIDKHFSNDLVNNILA